MIIDINCTFWLVGPAQKELMQRAELRKLNSELFLPESWFLQLKDLFLDLESGLGQGWLHVVNSEMCVFFQLK